MIKAAGRKFTKIWEPSEMGHIMKLQWTAIGWYDDNNNENDKGMRDGDNGEWRRTSILDSSTMEMVYSAICALALSCRNSGGDRLANPGYLSLEYCHYHPHLFTIADMVPSYLRKLIGSLFKEVLLKLVNRATSLKKYSLKLRSWLHHLNGKFITSKSSWND